MNRTSSTHITMSLHIGTNVRINARMSISSGQGAERVELSSFASSDEPTDGESFDVGVAICKTAASLTEKVCEELSSRGHESTAAQFREAFKENVGSDEGGVEVTLHKTLAFIHEIQWHFFSEYTKQ
jgi:hypothetical protein